MITLSAAIAFFSALFFSAPSSALVMQDSNDALFFDMMGVGAPSQWQKKEEAAQKTGDSYDPNLYKDVAAKLMSADIAEVPIVNLNILKNKQTLIFPAGRKIDFRLKEKFGINCMVECSSNIMRMDEKGKVEDDISLKYTAVSSGKAFLYVDCIEGQSGTVDSKIIILNVR